MGKLQGTYKAKKYVKMRLYQRYHYYKLTVDIYIIYRAKGRHRVCGHDTIAILWVYSDIMR